MERIGRFISIERRERYAIVRFQKGDDLNALSAEAMRDLTTTAVTLSRDASLSAVVLTGDPVFSGGFDLNDTDSNAFDQDVPLVERRERLKLGPDLCRAWESLEIITIAAVEKFAIGGGVALCLACDHRIMASDAFMRLPEVPLGMNMSWQSNPRLVALIGPSRAKRFVILGEKMYAEEAAQTGLADEMTAPGQTLAAAESLAARYAAVPPIPLRMSKTAINNAQGPLHHATSFMDIDQFLLTTFSQDLREGVTAFLEKRDPKFTGN